MGSHALGVQNLHDAIHYTSIEPPRVQRDTRKSHISVDAKSAHPLLFVSDDKTYDVYIFSMPKLDLKGTLTGFNDPQGMCSDKYGNVWITNAEDYKVVQYSHSGTFLKSLTDRNGYPVGCAVNDSTGDLAVTNIFDQSGNASVDVYADARGKPTVYSNATQIENFFAAYDNKGDLYVDGFSSSGFSLSEIRSGSSKMKTLSISGGTIYFPGGVNWSKATGLVIGDQDWNNAPESWQYALSVSGSTATITGSTPLTNYEGGACDVDQGTISSSGNYFFGECALITTANAGTVDQWTYPAGGAPVNYTTNVTSPIAAVISEMKK
ncbi:MAG: hypothetical protein JOZ77_07970 [Candidatus Eremiobacteraeota bacterium]|nr:hypothetical protein [Candidatus Eremiobacteraeota bacterium]